MLLHCRDRGFSPPNAQAEGRLCAPATSLRCSGRKPITILVTPFQAKRDSSASGKSRFVPSSNVFLHRRRQSRRWQEQRSSAVRARQRLHRPAPNPTHPDPPTCTFRQHQGARAHCGADHQGSQIGYRMRHKVPPRTLIFIPTPASSRHFERARQHLACAKPMIFCALFCVTPGRRPPESKNRNLKPLRSG